MPDLKDALEAIKVRRPVYLKAAEYYDGKHELAFASDKFKKVFGEMLAAFADNLCPAVVDATADRLEVTGFGVEQGPESAADAVWTIWTDNRMDRRAGETHLEALRSGDAYIIVWPDPETGRPTLYPNKAVGMHVAYDPEVPGRILWAAKAFTVGELARVNLYYPDRVEKWAAAKSAWTQAGAAEAAYQEHRVPGESWPLRNPWGRVPVFHFASNGDTGEYGRSELQNVIPLQRSLNKAICDMVVAMEFVALPQRWATGVEVEFGADGKPIPPWTPGVDRILVAGDPAVKFGEFGQADLKQFLAVQESFRSEIARVSGTPLHYLMLQAGEWPSGEALKTAEARFLAKLQDRQIGFGDAWENALGFALRVAGGPDVRLTCQWDDPTPRNERDMAETAKLKGEIGVTRTVLLSELGYNADEIAAMEVERAQQQAEQRALMAAARPAQPFGQARAEDDE